MKDLLGQILKRAFSVSKGYALDDIKIAISLEIAERVRQIQEAQERVNNEEKVD